MIDEAEARRLGINIDIFRQLTQPRQNNEPKPRGFGQVFNDVSPNTTLTDPVSEDWNIERLNRYVIPRKSGAYSIPKREIPPPRTPPGTPPSSRPSTPIPSDPDSEICLDNSSTIEGTSTHKRRDKHKKHKRDRRDKKDKIDKAAKSHKKHTRQKADQ